MNEPKNKNTAICDFMRCERCKEEIYKLEKCDFCNRKICRDCTKSSKNTSKLARSVICKDCWSDMTKRAKYKSYFKPGRRFEREER